MFRFTEVGLDYARSDILTTTPRKRMLVTDGNRFIAFFPDGGHSRDPELPIVIGGPDWDEIHCTPISKRVGDVTTDVGIPITTVHTANDNKFVCIVAYVTEDTLSYLAEDCKTITLGHLTDLAPADSLRLGDVKALLADCVPTSPYKFRILPDTATEISDGQYVYQIKAVRDIPERDVIAGDIGGWVEDYSSLSQRGLSWVHKGGFVYDGSSVIGDAVVQGPVKLSGRIALNHSMAIIAEA